MVTQHLIAAAGSFEQTLERTCAALEGFVRLLEAELREIATASQERIEALALEKRRHLDALQSLLSSASPSSDGGENILKIKQLAERARNAGARAARLNLASGQMIALRARVVDARLDTLAGAAGHTRTYGADGGLRMARGARSSITA